MGFLEVPCCSMKFLGVTWVSMGFHVVPQCSSGFQGVPGLLGLHGALQGEAFLWVPQVSSTDVRPLQELL